MAQETLQKLLALTFLFSLGTGQARKTQRFVFTRWKSFANCRYRNYFLLKEAVKPDDTFNMSQPKKLNTQVPYRFFVPMECCASAALLSEASMPLLSMPGETQLIHTLQCITCCKAQPCTGDVATSAIYKIT